MDSFMRGHLTIAAQAGTILGPNAFGELLVAKPCSHEDKPGRVELWTATPDDLDSSRRRDPQSVTEFRIQKVRGRL